MADGATIIAASLNSEELDNSINKLVETVNRKTKECSGYETFFTVAW